MYFIDVKITKEQNAFPKSSVILKKETHHIAAKMN